MAEDRFTAVAKGGIVDDQGRRGKVRSSVAPWSSTGWAKNSFKRLMPAMADWMFWISMPMLSIGGKDKADIGDEGDDGADGHAEEILQEGAANR